MFKFDYSIRNCRLMLAAIMQVRAYDPGLLYEDQWRELNYFFNSYHENPKVPPILNERVESVLGIVLSRWVGLKGYPDQFIVNVIDNQ